MGFIDKLGRKPARVAAWEERQQAKFNDEAVALAAWQRRNPDVTFAGRTIRVRSAPPGESLIDWSGMAWSNDLSWLTRLPAYLRDVRQRRADAWTVGIVLPSGIVSGERIVHREHVSTEAEVQPAVDEMVRRAEAGEFSPRRRSH